MESITVKHNWLQLNLISDILVSRGSYSFFSFKILAPGKKDDADMSFHVAWGDLWLDLGLFYMFLLFVWWFFVCFSGFLFVCFVIYPCSD